jgi:hypothetical protein
MPVGTANLGRARGAVDRLSFDCTGLDDFMFGLARESETAQVLVFHSYLDDPYAADNRAAARTSGYSGSEGEAVRE